MLVEILQVFHFQDGDCLPSCIFKFSYMFVASIVGTANVHHHTKFSRNGTNNCRFNVFLVVIAMWDF